MAIPSDNNFSTIKEGIRSTINERKLNALIADEIHLPIDIFCKICNLIDISQIFIAEVSTKRGNIFLELGVAFGKGKYAILLKKRNAKIISDIPSQERIDYLSLEELKEKLGSTLDSVSKTLFTYN